MSSSASIVFSYSDNRLVRTALREFHVFAVDSAHNRLGAAIVVSPGAIPTAAAPLVVPMPEGASEVEVTPIDVDGWEGGRAYLAVATAPGPPSPVNPPAAAAHGMMMGQTRYLNYEQSPGCSDCANVFPQGLQLLRLHDAQCSFNEIATSPDPYEWEWSTLDSHLDSCEARGVQVLYTLSYTPEWAYDSSFTPQWPEPGVRSPHSNYPPRLDVLEEFFRALLDHCRRPDGSSRIQYVEAWNETNALAFWCGTDQILLDQQKMLWRVIQEKDPSILLSTPTPTLNMSTIDEAIDCYLKQGFQNYSNIVSFHGYTEKGLPGDAIGPTLERVNQVMAANNCDHPLWDTEFNQTQGFADDGCIAPEDVPQWIEDALVVRMQNGISCAVWFEWDNPNACGSMCTWRGEINAAGYAWIDFFYSIHPLRAVENLAAV
jgi:hypothetical protein